MILWNYIGFACTSEAQSIGSRQAMDAVSAIRAVGGDVQFIEENGEIHIKSIYCYDIENGENIINLIPFDDELQSFSFVKSKISDGVFRNVRFSKNLRMLRLDNTQVGDSILLKLKDCILLHILSLGGTKITNSGLRNIEKLKNLRVLKLNDTAITDEGLGFLAGLKKLDSIFLDGNKIKDNGIRNFKEFSNLQSLSLRGTGVTDQGLLHLKGNVRLRVLNLSFTQTEGLFLRDNCFPGLEALFVGDTNLREENFLRLENLKLLRYVDVSGAGITEESINIIKKKFLDNGIALTVVSEE